MTICFVADGLGIDAAIIPKVRMTHAEQEFLAAVVERALHDMSLTQKARILVLFLIHGRTKSRKPSASVLLKIGISETAELMQCALA